MIRGGNSRLTGAEVNVASKLGEDIAEACEILVSDDARKGANDVPGLAFTITGMHQSGSPEVYRVTPSVGD